MRAPSMVVRSVAGCAAAVILLAGCSDDGPSSEPEAQSADDTGTSAPPSVEQAPADDTSATSKAGVADEDSQTATSQAGVEARSVDVIAEQTGPPRPDRPDDQVTVGIQSLTVQGKTMVLEILVTPRFRSVSGSEVMSIYDIDQQLLNTGLMLIDRENLKEYSMISDGPVEWASDPVQTTTVNGQPAHVFAVFAAPEDDVDSLDVRVNANWPVFTDIPITR